MERDPNEPDGRVSVLLSLLALCAAILLVVLQVYALIYGG